MQDGETLNAAAKSAAYSAFEQAKQRFFGHLLATMKCPSLIRAIEKDLLAGRAPVIQLVSTGEALLERRLAVAGGSRQERRPGHVALSGLVVDHFEQPAVKGDVHSPRGSPVQASRPAIGESAASTGFAGDLGNSSIDPTNPQPATTIHRIRHILASSVAHRL